MGLGEYESAICPQCFATMWDDDGLCSVCASLNLEVIEADAALRTLAANIDVAAALTAVHTLAYQKGFDDGTMLREFCNPVWVSHPYFPTADSRPTAERLGWVAIPNS